MEKELTPSRQPATARMLTQPQNQTRGGYNLAKECGERLEKHSLFCLDPMFLVLPGVETRVD